MRQSALGTALVIATASAVTVGCFGPGPGYDHRDVVYVDRGHQDHHQDHHDHDESS